MAFPKTVVPVMVKMYNRDPRAAITIEGEPIKRESDGSISIPVEYRVVAESHGWTAEAPQKK